MQAAYPDLFIKKYDISGLKDKTPDDILQEVTLMRNILMTGGLPDTERMSVILLDEFKNGKFGRITLEAVEDSLERTEEI